MVMKLSFHLINLGNTERILFRIAGNYAMLEAHVLDLGDHSFG